MVYPVVIFKATKLIKIHASCPKHPILKTHTHKRKKISVCAQNVGVSLASMLNDSKNLNLQKYSKMIAAGLETKTLIVMIKCSNHKLMNYRIWQYKFPKQNLFTNHPKWNLLDCICRIPPTRGASVQILIHQPSNLSHHNNHILSKTIHHNLQNWRDNKVQSKRRKVRRIQRPVLATNLFLRGTPLFLNQKTICEKLIKQTWKW